MLYHWFEIGHAAVKPARLAAGSARLMLNHPLNPIAHTPYGRSAAAACEVFERTTRRYAKPEFGLTETIVNGEAVLIREDVVYEHPFCELIRFTKEMPEDQVREQPRVLLVSPMSGHFATLLRGTVEAFLPDHEVYITDWRDARQVPVAYGTFDLDDYIDVVRDMLSALGGDVHVVAVCQPSVPVLAAVALMEESDHPHAPNSLTMMGGPIDTRISPTEVNKLAESKGTEWFANNVINSVPWPNLGCGRRVYPGFLQLTGFMTMNLDRHVQAHRDLFNHLVEGDGDSAAKHRDFYDEYLAVMDLTSEFYLQTIETVFVGHHLARGMMTHRGRPVRPEAIRNVPLFTVEGGKDDITGAGQCRAALDLCANVPKSQKTHYEAPGVGHYGIFNGSRFREMILPKLSRFIAKNEPPERVRQSREVLLEIEAAGMPDGALSCARRLRRDAQHALSALETGALPKLPGRREFDAPKSRGRKKSVTRRRRRSRQTASVA
ncbi:MAG: polyhydroxyalkanoate depolymerase [Pseudomonadota bacterium]